MSLSDLLLLLTPGLPLLLVLPWLRRWLPRAEYVAILPTFLLLVLPGDHYIELPWLLLNAGFCSVGNTRLLLVMSLLLWIPAAFYLSSGKVNVASQAGEKQRSFFLLTLAGYLATVLAIDIISFFTFSTLMGYGFYGLLVHAGDEQVKRAGRIYLCFMVVADLLLFEAVLIASAVTEEQSFDTVRDTMAYSSSLGLYLSIVVLGFALKAGLWPFHFWLPLAFRSARQPVTVLLAGVPVAIGLLGMVRWLPLGDVTLLPAGLILQSLGGLAMLYAMLGILIRRQLATFPAYVTILITGLFCIGLGSVLSDPVIWGQMNSFVFYYIVFLGVGIALLSSIMSYYRKNNTEPLIQKKDSILWFERWSGLIVRYSKHFALAVLPRLRTSCLTAIQSFWQLDDWKKRLQSGEYVLQRWSLAITLFLLLTIAAVLMAPV